MTKNKRFTFNSQDCMDNDEFWLDLSLPTYSNIKEICKALNKLHEENIQLKSINLEYEDALGCLEERNNHQAKQLNNLYNLIEKQDWKTLTGIIMEFQECEKQLQREWRCYE